MSKKIYTTDVQTFVIFKTEYILRSTKINFILAQLVVLLNRKHSIQYRCGLIQIYFPHVHQGSYFTSTDAIFWLPHAGEAPQNVDDSGIILGMGSANERRCYIVTLSLLG